jgi:hypothetical protein
LSLVTGRLKHDLAYRAVDDADHRRLAVHGQAFTVRHCLHDKSRLHWKQRNREKKRAYRNKKQSAHERGSLGIMIMPFQILKALKKIDWQLVCF